MSASATARPQYLPMLLLDAPRSSAVRLVLVAMSVPIMSHATLPRWPSRHVAERSGNAAMAAICTSAK